jgi:hypothetical protein
MMQSIHLVIVIFGIVCTFMLTLSKRILDFDLMLYEKWGLTKLHRTVSEHRDGWLLLLRLFLSICIIAALISLFAIR